MLVSNKSIDFLIWSVNWYRYIASIEDVDVWKNIKNHLYLHATIVKAEVYVKVWAGE